MNSMQKLLSCCRAATQALFGIAVYLPAVAGTLNADPDPLNLGLVSVSSGPAADLVTLTNTGTNSEINGFSTGGSCAEFSVQSADSLPVVLGNGESLSVNVHYDPVDRTADTCSVTTLSSGTGGAFTLQGDGAAASLNTQVSTLNFASQRWNGGTPQIMNITIENTGEESIDESNLAAVLATGTHFSVGAAVGLPIGNGGIATLPVTFDPASAGSKLDTVTVSLNNDSPLESNDVVNISGTGTQSVQTFSTATLDIGSFPAASGSGTAVIDVGNTGSASLNLTSVSISGTHAAEFSFEDHGCNAQGPCVPDPAQIAVSGSTEPFSIRCTPAAAGVRSAMLSVASDDPGSPRSANLQCTGTNPSGEIFEDGFESDN